MSEKIVSPNSHLPEGPSEASGVRYVGTHLNLDLWGSSDLNDSALVESTFRDAVNACGAMLVDLYVHHFRPQGVTGVALLPASHMSIHTWPEVGYAAVDIFTCGDSDPYLAIPAFRDAFRPERLQVTDQKRGVTMATALA